MANRVARGVVWVAALTLGATAVRAEGGGGKAPDGPAADQAHARLETGRGEVPARHEKRTVLHFDDDSIRGDLTRPDGELVQAPRRVSYGSLVRLRKSFVDRALAGVVRGQ